MGHRDEHFTFKYPKRILVQVVFTNQLLVAVWDRTGKKFEGIV
jgi:hypothetical protein